MSFSGDEEKRGERRRGEERRGEEERMGEEERGGEERRREERRSLRLVSGAQPPQLAGGGRVRLVGHAGMAGEACASRNSLAQPEKKEAPVNRWFQPRSVVQTITTRVQYNTIIQYIIQYNITSV